MNHTMTTEETLEWHRRLNESLGNGPCTLAFNQPWPYECVAQDEHPDHEVIVCTAHNVWTHRRKRCVGCGRDIQHSAIAYCDTCN